MSHLKERNTHGLLVGQYDVTEGCPKSTKSSMHTISFSFNFNSQNQNSSLVKRQNDNTSPGDWPRKISP